MGGELTSAFGALLLNVSLLLAFAHVFHLTSHNPRWREGPRRQFGAGVAAGAVCVALMLAPYRLEPGIQFDARSVVLALTGLFFGPLATVVTAGIAAGFRLWLGGTAAWAGVGVIGSSAALGLLFHRRWGRDRAKLRWPHLLALGLGVHAVMLGWMFVIPEGAGPRVVQAIALPVLTLNPLATLALGLTLVGRLRSQAHAEAVAQQEARFRLLAENAHDVVYRFELAPAPRFSYVSPSVTRLVGYTPEEHYADPTLGERLISEEDQTLLREVLAGQRDPAAPLLLRWRHRDGRMVWTEQRITLVRDDAGALVAIEGTARDVTAREEATAHLREREEAYRQLFEAHPRPLWVYDVETLRFLAVNDAAVRHYGYSRDEFLAMSLTELRPPEDGTPHSAHGVDDAGVERHRTKEGRLLEVALASHRLTFEGRRAELVLAEDVTAERVAQLKRERLFTAIEQFPDSVVITDRAGEIEYVNPAFERSSGYARAEVLRQNPRVLKSGQQDDAFYREMWATLTDGRSWTGRMVNRRKDGTLYTEDASISPVRDVRGVIVSFVAVKRDVTRQLELEAQYLQAQKMESIGRLAAGVAHDFNNLLTIINSTSELAGLDAPPGSQLGEDLKEIRAAGQRGAALTRQLLSFTRQQVVKPVVLEPDQVVGGFEKLLRRLMTEDVHLEVRTGAPGCRVLADPGQLEQIVLNLAVNARDAIQAGGRVTLETAMVPGPPEEGASLRPSAPRGPCLRLSVQDTGVGMAPDVLDHLFTPFFTTKEVGKGTGLGLSTVLRLVGEARGGIRVRSEPGQGSTFEVYLPVVTARLTPEPFAAPTFPSAEAAVTVMVVEDDDTVRPLTTRVLERAGYRAVAAAHGREALELIERGAVKPALVVTDVVMPELGGLELAEALARVAPDVPVIFVSGYAPQAGQPLPPERFLAKPYTSDSLLAAVRHALRTKARDG